MKEPLIGIICTIVVLVVCVIGINSCEENARKEIEMKYMEFSSECLFIPIEEFDDFLKKNSSRIKCFAPNDTGMYGMTIGYYVILEEEKSKQ